MEASGPRIVVFEVGGTIDMMGRALRITNPYLTIAGQTAPGDGILLKDGDLKIQSHDVVIRGLRIRVKVPENEAAYDALSRYGAVTTGALHSVGSEGEYDLGVRQGVGSWADTTYDLTHAGRGAISQVTVYEAKKRNPELTMFAHRGLKHIPALYFGYSTNSPQRWFIDRLSPRWFAYTPLIELQEPVTRTSQLTFRFRPEDVQQWRN